GHPTTWTGTAEFTEISTLLADEPPNWAKVCCVMVASRWLESMNVVASVFPFHSICDWGTKLFPITMSRTDEAFREMAFGDRTVIWGAAGMPGQLLNPMIAEQVQRDRAKLIAATKATRSQDLIPGKPFRLEPEAGSNGRTSGRSGGT